MGFVVWYWTCRRIDRCSPHCVFLSCTLYSVRVQNVTIFRSQFW